MMRKVISAFTLIVTFCSSAQFPLSSEEMKKDFEIFKNSISEIHPGLYWYADSTEIALRFSKIENAIQEKMELKDFYVLLQEFYANIRCGHSWMSMPWKWRKHIDEGPYRIPINFYLEEDKIFAMRDLTDDQSIGEGAEIVSINGMNSKEILSTLTPYAPTDGYSKPRQTSIIFGNFSRYFQAVYGMDSIFQIELKDDSSTETVTLKGLANAEANKRSTDRYGASKKEEKMLSYKELEGSVGYIKIQSFDGDNIKEGNQKFKKFLKRSFKSIEDNNLEKLIIDLRGNGGGEDNYGATLASYLLDEPFDYYLRMEAVTRKFNYNEYSRQKGFNMVGKLLKKDKEKPGTYTYNHSRQVKKQKPMKRGFSGDVVVLIDGGSFSATSEVAAILHTNKRATFIGEETGGGYYGNNSAMMYGIQLPHSKINYYLPVIRYYVAVDHPPFEGRGVIPDIGMPETYQDYITEEDEALIRAIKELQN
ncbi:MAG: S41 family peptidase [Ekhidna sp.]